MAVIFLSHASADRRIALLLTDLLTSAFLDAKPTVTIFCSSDIGDIEGGKKWFDEIMRHLKQATACVAIMTPQSIHYSPWVAYESGGAYLRFENKPNRSRLFPVTAYGITGRTVPSPFNELQVRDLANTAETITLCREIATCIGRGRPRIPRGLIQKLTEEAGRGLPHWDLVHPTLVGQRQGSSPFNFDSLLKLATTEIFCAGFNLHHLATTPRCKADLFEFLRQSSARRVRLLVADPKESARFAAWEMIGKSFLDDLRRAVRQFRRWVVDARRLKLKGSLEVKLTTFVGLTIVCIDPESSDAQLVLTPSIVGKPLSVDRPHFLLSRKRQPAEFAYYWDAYHDLFRRSTPI